MTWFLDESAEPTGQLEPLTGQIPSRGQQFVGAVRDTWTRQNTWNAKQGYRNDLINEMAQAAGGLEKIMPRNREETVEYKDPVTRGYYVAKRIAELRQNDPEGRFAGLPATPEEFDAAWTARQKRDFDENAAMLKRGDSWGAQTLGGLGAAVVDPVNIALTPLGGPVGGGVRFVAAEAAIGAVSALPGIMAEQEESQRLGFEPGDPLMSIGMGAVGQGAFAAVGVGAGRVLSYRRTRAAGEAAARPVDRDGLSYQQDVDAAEADLRVGRDPQAPGRYRPDATLPAEHDPAVLNIARAISRIEAPAGFDQVFGGSVIRPPRPLTKMTINEVLDWQARSTSAGSKSSAAGAFQIIQDTLRATRDSMGLTGNELYDEAMQMRMGVHLMKGRGLDDWRAGRISTEQFIDGLAQEWAAVPRATGPNAGRSHYDGDGLNASQVGLDDFRAYVDGEHVPDQIPRGGGGGSTGPTGIPVAGRSIADEFGTISTPGGMDVNVRYRIVDAGDLHRATGDLQPRDRSRAASDEQIANIARELDARRLMPSPEATSGTPIIGPDMMVESGNGRIAAINRAADEHPERYAAYVQALEDAGYQVPTGVKRPVLVAERVTELDFEGRRRFVRESNASSIGRMSATEQAGVDADYLSRHAFDAFQGGRGLNSAENAEFVRRVFTGMPQAERAGLMTGDGRLNIDGIRRLRQALFARAFDAQDLLKLVAETEHPAVENLLRMLEDLAPDWAAFRSAVDAGFIRPEFDITEPLMGAVRMIARARIEDRDGQSVIAALRDRLAQGDMFTRRDPEMTDAVIGVFYKGDRARGPDASANILTRYMSEAEMAGRADIEDMFAAEAGLTPAGVLRAAIKDQDARAPMPARAATEVQDGPAGAVPDIRGLDALDTAEGAQSPVLARATDAELRDLREGQATKVETGPFGPMFRDIEDNPEGAIARLLSEKQGEVPVAFRHPDSRIGDVALVYGNEKMGLRHIEAKHPEMVSEIPRLLRDGEVIPDDQGLKRIFIADDAHPANVLVMRLDYDGQDKTWVVTSFDDKWGKFARDRKEAYRTDLTDARDPASSGQITQHLRTSDKPDAGVSSRVPDTTGHAQDSASVPDFQSDEIASAIAQARAALEAEPELVLRLGDGPGAQEIRLADFIDDLDQDESLIRSMTSCSLKGTPK